MSHSDAFEERWAERARLDTKRPGQAQVFDLCAVTDENRVTIRTTPGCDRCLFLAGDQVLRCRLSAERVELAYEQPRQPPPDHCPLRRGPVVVRLGVGT